MVSASAVDNVPSLYTLHQNDGRAKTKLKKWLNKRTDLILNQKMDQLMDQGTDLNFNQHVNYYLNQNLNQLSNQQMD